MSRREFLMKSSLGISALGTGLFSVYLQGCNRAKKLFRDKSPPNILLIVADDAGWRDVGYHQSEIKTPNIDKLTKTGVEFDQFYVCPTCSPTRASLLTGRYASRYGILGPIAMKSKQTLPADVLTLPALLKKNGYSTAITGKWHLGLRTENGPRQYGFDNTYGYLHGQIDQYTHKYKNGDKSWHRNDKFIEEEGHATDLITNEAIQFIKNLRAKSKPFFLYVPFSVPHYPLQEREEWIAPYKNSIQNESRRLFAASVTHMDHAIGQLIQTLEKENLRENTLIIFISDNGGQEEWHPKFEYKMQHGPNDRLGDNRPLRDWKGSLYEGGIRVPACFNWPGKLSPRKVDQPVHVNDILPTVASMIGVPIPSNTKLNGKNVWPSISKGQPFDERPIYWRTDKQMALRKGNWKLVHTGPTLDEGINELYHISDDPHEKINVVDNNPGIAETLFEALKQQVKMDFSSQEERSL